MRGPHQCGLVWSTRKHMVAHKDSIYQLYSNLRPILVSNVVPKKSIVRGPDFQYLHTLKAGL